MVPASYHRFSRFCCAHDIRAFTSVCVCVCVCKGGEGSSRAPPRAGFVVCCSNSRIPMALDRVAASVGVREESVYPVLHCVCTDSCRTLPRFLTDRKTSRTALLFLRSFLSTAFLALFLSRGSQRVYANGCVDSLHCTECSVHTGAVLRAVTFQGHYSMGFELTDSVHKVCTIQWAV